MSQLWRSKTHFFFIALLSLSICENTSKISASSYFFLFQTTQIVWNRHLSRESFFEFVYIIRDRQCDSHIRPVRCWIPYDKITYGDCINICVLVVIRRIMRFSLRVANSRRNTNSGWSVKCYPRFLERLLPNNDKQSNLPLKICSGARTSLCTDVIWLSFRLSQFCQITPVSNITINVFNCIYHQLISCSKFSIPFKTSWKT